MQHILVQNDKMLYPLLKLAFGRIRDSYFRSMEKHSWFLPDQIISNSRIFKDSYQTTKKTHIGDLFDFIQFSPFLDFSGNSTNFQKGITQWLTDKISNCKVNYGQQFLIILIC